MKSYRRNRVVKNFLLVQFLNLAFIYVANSYVSGTSAIDSTKPIAFITDNLSIFILALMSIISSFYIKKASQFFAGKVNERQKFVDRKLRLTISAIVW